MNKIELLLKELNPHFEQLLPFIEQKITELNKNLSYGEKSFFSEKDTMLITYADQFSEKGKNNLQALRKFVNDDLQGCTSIVHLLPFYPWTSDDGFSPIDYQTVCSDYGSWEDIEALPQEKMFDCVFNHLSSQNSFFQKALKGDKESEKMFHVVSKSEYEKPEFQENITKVVRPRTSSLFSQYDFAGEEKFVWTTFSKDQIDTNLSNTEMLKYILESFFLYVEKGAQYFRIDAVPFLWKEWGTNCSHLPKTHQIVQLFRAIVEQLNTHLYIVTESNVPHHENISYWGNGENEAHIIYNFSLAPLILHGLVNQTNQYLNEWAKDVFKINKKTTFLNFTATHDGIGMRGLEGIVPDGDVENLCQLAVEKGGQIGKKKSRDGTVRPYELNITWASMMEDSELDAETYMRKVANSHAVVMFFPGVGAHYVHNFLGTKNWTEGFEESGIARRLNRQKLTLPLSLDQQSKMIRDELIRLVKFKSSNPLFSPTANFKILQTNPKCLSFERSMDGQKIDVHFNLSSEEITVAGNKLKSYELIFK